MLKCLQVGGLCLDNHMTVWSLDECRFDSSTRNNPHDFSTISLSRPISAITFIHCHVAGAPGMGDDFPDSIIVDHLGVTRQAKPPV